ncbi:DUF349 domain-containing protein [Ornithobacterium rhinotracheale]|uniref:DUF349 domain-containing protein n=2 Tax=Ornithobacterium rhinotracheale TaxID=28251 RepID=A0A3R5UUK3_ORNRH|nr:DUF349 domain-containing protein [Ornithobacterium rhinotracheale]QAR30816.1 DUF349 domain-containing protein [Ornithobacterium rhinotracheale]
MSIEKENLLNADSNVNEAEALNTPSESNVAPTQEKDYDENADNDQHQDQAAEEHEQDGAEHQIPQKDYDEMSMPELVAELTHLMGKYPVMKLREAFQQIKEAFFKHFSEAEQEAKEKFLAQGGDEIDFKYETKDRYDFNKISREFKNRLQDYYKSIEQKEKESLKEREAITEELKALYTEPNSDANIFKKFRELKTRWHNAGRIPKAKASNVFNNYYFHLDNFYKFLDLNQELRKMDYEHNLNVRHLIIARAENLLHEENVQKALNELQYLHRMWKEEAVPVAEEHREPTWQKFKELTAKLHDRKEELNIQIQAKLAQNLEKKNEIIEKISQAIEGQEIKSHNLWQKKIKEIKKLRDEYFAIGRVPKAQNQSIWERFKEVTSHFNRQKNAFYKNMKAEQMENLEKKRKLVEIAKEHKDSTNWNESAKVIKRIQTEWKKIGHVPRKYSDKIWKEFNEANNQFFDRFKNRNNEKLEQQNQNLKAKQELLEEIKNAEKPSDKDALIKWLNEYNIRWSSIGFVPNGKLDINKDFTHLTQKILKDAGLDKDAIEKAQWENQLEQIKQNLDEKLLRNLKFDLKKKIDEKQKEVSQLQTNLSFFSNADDSNPLFKSAISSIEAHIEELSTLKAKFNDLKKINLAILSDSEEE